MRERQGFRRAAGVRWPRPARIGRSALVPDSSYPTMRPGRYVEPFRYERCPRRGLINNLNTEMATVALMIIISGAEAGWGWYRSKPAITALGRRPPSRRVHCTEDAVAAARMVADAGQGLHVLRERRLVYFRMCRSLWRLVSLKRPQSHERGLRVLIRPVVDCTLLRVGRLAIVGKAARARPRRGPVRQQHRTAALRRRDVRERRRCVIEGRADADRQRKNPSRNPATSTSSASRSGLNNVHS